MALVLVSGLACSGCTSRSRELIQDFERRQQQSSPSSSSPPYRLIHLTNADAQVSRDAFSTQLQEKPARAAYLSTVTRHLARDAIVIADNGAGLNIKGFRYQLWCAAREVGIRCISILCVARPDVCRKRNEKRLRNQLNKTHEKRSSVEQAYDEATLNELLMRFEEPNPMTRWDAPLFVIDCNPLDKEVEAGHEAERWEAAPLDTIWAAVSKGDAQKAPDVVAPSKSTNTNYLSLLETVTQLVLSALQAMGPSLPEMGGPVQLAVRMPSSQTGETRICLTLPTGKRPPSTAALQRMRRQFVKMHATGAAAQNEIGQVMNQEGRRAALENASRNGAKTNSKGADITEDSRVDQKGQEHPATTSSRSDGQTRSPEEDIAHRFVAYLEETL